MQFLIPDLLKRPLPLSQTCYYRIFSKKWGSFSVFSKKRITHYIFSKLWGSYLTFSKLLFCWRSFLPGRNLLIWQKCLIRRWTVRLLKNLYLKPFPFSHLPEKRCKSFFSKAPFLEKKGVYSRFLEKKGYLILCNPR